MRLSNEARREKTVGEIVNMMAIDVERFQIMTMFIQQIWSCPLQARSPSLDLFQSQILLSLAYLCSMLGLAAVPGVVVMVLLVPFNIYTSVFIKRWQVQQMRVKDERTKMCNEVLNGIKVFYWKSIDEKDLKVIKLYAWEEPMRDLIEKLRQRELQLIKRAALVRSVIDCINMASPFVVSCLPPQCEIGQVALLSFGGFTLTSQLLTPEIAFVSLTLFNQLRAPVNVMAMIIQLFVQVCLIALLSQTEISGDGEQQTSKGVLRGRRTRCAKRRAKLEHSTFAQPLFRINWL